MGQKITRFLVLESDKKAPSSFLYHLSFIVRVVEGVLQHDI
jgi:hypothetical protein